jgi:poly(A) polymerase Pap1
MQSFANIREPRPRIQPVASGEPSLRDQRANQKLVAYLTQMNLYEPEEDSRKRESVLAALHELVLNWCKEVFVSKVGFPRLAHDSHFCDRDTQRT